MSQFDYIKEIAKHGLENNQEELLKVLNELVTYSKKTRKTNFAIQLQSILKDGLRERNNSQLTIVGTKKHQLKEHDQTINDFIIEKITSDYDFSSLVANDEVFDKLKFFVKEHKNIDVLNKYDLPVSNKILFYGNSGCGKTLAAYVMAGELKKMMVVINLGSVVSSKLGETSKNLLKIFRSAALEDSIIFFDEFDSLGKVRDYNQDHGEMKRVVNTILQLFDYLPQSSIVVAATNQKEMIDEALLRRFDMGIKFGLPSKNEIIELIDKTLKNGLFSFDNKTTANSIMKYAQGLSYYTIQKTLIDAIKRSLFSNQGTSKENKIDTKIWKELLEQEKQYLSS